MQMTYCAFFQVEAWCPLLDFRKKLREPETKHRKEVLCYLKNILKVSVTAQRSTVLKTLNYKQTNKQTNKQNKH